MSTFNGTMAGIGNKEENVNVIEPYFDATIRNFIIGKDYVLEGLQLNGSTLTSGACVSHGFVGYLPNDVQIPASDKFIYGVFTVNHDRNTLDEFYIESLPTAGKTTGLSQVYYTVSGVDIDSDGITFTKELDDRAINITGDPTTFGDNSTVRVYSGSGDISQYYDRSYRIDDLAKTVTVTVTRKADTPSSIPFCKSIEVRLIGQMPLSSVDILHEKGQYYMPLYANGIPQYITSATSGAYPQNAVSADRCSMVTDEIGVGAILPADIEADTDDWTVANCKFVHDAIERDIGYVKKTVVSDMVFDGGTVYGVKVEATLTLSADFYHKGNYVLVNNAKIELASHSGGGNYTIPAETVLATVDQVFAPKTDKYLFGITGGLYSSAGDTHLVKINSKGQLLLNNALEWDVNGYLPRIYLPYGAGYDKLT